MADLETYKLFLRQSYWSDSYQEVANISNGNSYYNHQKTYISLE